MKYLFYSLILLTSSITISCKEAGHTHEEEEKAHHDTNEIVLQPEVAKQFGVETSVIGNGDFNEVIKVSGKIYPAQSNKYTISATKAGIVQFIGNINLGSTVEIGEPIASISANHIVGGDDSQKARITLENAKSEYERLKSLYNEKIITERDFIAAKEAFQQAQNAYKPQSEAANSAIAGTITALYVDNGSFVEKGTPIATVSANNFLTLQADMPERYGNMNIASANFRPAYSDSTYSMSALNGKLLSQSRVSSNGYIPVYFSFKGNEHIVTNSYADVFLIGQLRHNVLTVPVSALTEEQGEYFVYEKIDAECYTKHLVKTGMSDGYQIEICSGITSGMEIVTHGAIIVKLAANAGAVPGHSHEH